MSTDTEKTDNREKAPKIKIKVPGFKNIVVPTDLSEESLAALGPAFYFAKQGAKIHLLHVGASAGMIISQYPTFIPPEDLSDSVEARAMEDLEKIIAEHVPGEIEIEPVVLIGTPFIEIIGLARSVEADLIILATHGRSALKQMLLGSTAESVIHKAPCSVMTVKSIDTDFEMP